MSIKQAGDGSGYVLDIRPEGRDGKRLRKKFKRKIDAQNYETKLKSMAMAGESLSTKKDTRKLSELIDLWYTFHGNTLTTGKQRQTILHAICRTLGDPLALNLSNVNFLEYRTHKLSIKRNDGTQKYTENHLNHELIYLKAVYSKLIELEIWRDKNPLANIKPLKLDKKKPYFLQLNDIEALYSQLKVSKNPDVEIITDICLSTGCRWGEAQNLTASDLHSGRVNFENTKNGRSRSVPIEAELETKILSGRPKRGFLFGSAWKAFENALERAGITPPRGTQTHVLRHTYASHFMIDGGNILVLNKILGHETLEMTLVYAHLAPEHLESATLHTPLKRLEKQRGSEIVAP